MPKRRSQVALTPEEEIEILNEGRTIQIATIGQDGYPHLVAMWYSVVDGDVCFSTYGTSQKVMNLRRDPKVSAMVELGHAYSELRGLVIKGKAEIVEAGTPEREALEPKFLELNGPRYGGSTPISAPPAGTPRPGLSPKRVIIRIHAESTYSWDHRKLAKGVY
ncbi:MAG TPA: pyridoxamine 5'-phosphate oxidase family protein [Tepidiformaceae bacterium]|nr:pyridoxamine 5'-phosphate oxidase family protein [Tepidiformaceae bacterium]